MVQHSVSVRPFELTLTHTQPFMSLFLCATPRAHKFTYAISIYANVLSQTHISLGKVRFWKTTSIFSEINADKNVDWTSTLVWYISRIYCGTLAHVLALSQNEYRLGNWVHNVCLLCAYTQCTTVVFSNSSWYARWHMRRMLTHMQACATASRCQDVKKKRRKTLTRNRRVVFHLIYLYHSIYLPAQTWHRNQDKINWVLKKKELDGNVCVCVFACEPLPPPSFRSFKISSNSNCLFVDTHLSYFRWKE